MNYDKSVNQENLPEYDRRDKESDELIKKIDLLIKQLEKILCEERGLTQYQYISQRNQGVYRTTS